MVADASTEQATYPRQLRAKEKDAIEFVLPPDHSGYREYRLLIAKMSVIGAGRRGKGNLVLGIPGDVADNASPLPPVIAYGMIETTRDTFSITVREYVGGQIDVEIVSAHGEEIPDHYEEKRRWTYSSWLPGNPSPATEVPVREIRLNPTLTLAVAQVEKRVWLHDGTTMMNHLIPITNFYNELMLHTGMRDPKIALKSQLLFERLDAYTDQDLRAAFFAYNRVHKKVEAVEPEPERKKAGLLVRLRRLFQK